MFTAERAKKRPGPPGQDANLTKYYEREIFEQVRKIFEVFFTTLHASGEALIKHKYTRKEKEGF